MSRYDVFLSHASADKPAVEQLAQKLREEGIEPFLDIWHLVAGQPWQEALERAVGESGCCAVFFGPVSKGGAWRNQETQLALARAAQDASFGVIPILLPGAKAEDVPGFLSLRTWVDFRNSLGDPGAFTHLIASIRAQPRGSQPHSSLDREAYRCMAPAREPFVQRNEYAKVRDALLAGSGTLTVGITTAIHGAGGFGKTALAIELCYDGQVREHYSDGILWTTMGEELDAVGCLARVRDLIRWWSKKEPPAFETVSAASSHLRQELGGKRVLLVVDDVWRPEDIAPFQGLTLLGTTRDSQTLPTEAIQIRVDALEVPEAVRLLGYGLPVGASVNLRELAKRLGEWPLLLKIVNRQLRELLTKDQLSLEQSLQEVNEALDAEGLTAFDREDLESRNHAVSRTIGASLRRLSGDEVSRFEQLAIFPVDKDIPLPVLEKLWGLVSFATRKICDRLHGRSLILRFDRQSATDTIRLHAVIQAYLLKRGESRLVEWNRRLLDTFRPANDRWPELPRGESYLWNQLVHHLTGAEESDLCRKLLLDFKYLQSKMAATDINSLLGDYSSFANREEFRLVRDALRISAHILGRHPNELSGQLLGRLLDRQEAGIRSLLQSCENSGTPWLRPRQPTLARPGGALIRTIDHSGEASSLAVLSGGRAVSGSSEGTLRVWDVESGKILQTLEGHSGVVSAVAVLDYRRVVTGSSDWTLRVWDVESGKTLQTLNGHSGVINAVAVLDSRRVVSGSSDWTLRVWDLENGKTLQTLKGHSGVVRAVAVLDSDRVVCGSSDGTLQVWDVENEKTLQILKGHSNGVGAVAVLSSRRVVSGSDDRSLRVWDLESGHTIQTLEGHSNSVRAVAVLDRFDSRRVVSGASDRTLRVWDVESGEALQTLERHSNWVRSVAVLDSHRVVSGSDDQTLRVWDVESGKTLQTLEGHSNRVNAVAVLDSHRVVSASADRTLRVWDVWSGKTLQVLEGHSDGVSAVAVLDSHRVVSASADRTLRVWDVWSGKTLQVLEGHSQQVRAVAVLDSRRVVSGSDWTLQVWDVESGQTLQMLAAYSAWVRAVAVLDSHRVVSGSGDRTLRVWDVESGQTLRMLEGHSNWVHAVAVLDSRRVISGSDDETMRVWDVESGKVECLFTLDAPVTAIAVIPDRRIIVAGDQTGRVHFFDFVEP